MKLREEIDALVGDDYPDTTDKILALFSETLDKLEGELPKQKAFITRTSSVKEWGNPEFQKLLRKDAENNLAIPGYNQALSEVGSLIERFKGEL